MRLTIIIMCALLVSCALDRQIGISPDSGFVAECSVGQPVPINHDPVCRDRGLPTVIQYFDCLSDAERFAAEHITLWIHAAHGSPGYHVKYCCEVRCTGR